jgi:hypothetical protein
MIDQPGMAGKPMTCPQCRNTFAVPEVRLRDALPSLRDVIATLIVIVGGLTACFYIFLFEVSVATESGGRVNNLGLMHNQLIGVISGIGLALFGAIVRMR